MSIDTVLRDSVIAIARVLRDPSSVATAQRTAVEALYTFGFTGGDWAVTPSKRLAEGLAIAPKDAATCILDHRRTALFLRALDSAIGEAARSFKERPLRVLYAGCGPLAPFALLASCLYPPELVRFRLVDIHAESLAAASRLFDALGHAASIEDCLCADATTLQLDSSYYPHISIAETLQQALFHEPQVALTLNLARQMVPGGIWLPRRIRVELVLADLALEHANAGALRRRLVLGRLLDLTAHHADALTQQRQNSGDNTLPTAHWTVPYEALNMHVLLCTRIEPGADLLLDEYESGLTHPYVCHALGTPSPGMQLMTRYRFGGKPGFEIELAAIAAEFTADPSRALKPNTTRGRPP